MIISHQHRFIFLKSSKTAGTSIELALARHCGPADVITPVGRDEAIRKQLGIRGPQNRRIPLSRYGLRDWGYLIRDRELQLFRNHASARQVHRWVGNRVWRDYFVFCFERNPYDKAVSRYYWDCVRRGKQNLTINEYLRTAHHTRLSNWHIYTIDDRIAVDFVGRYERLDEDLRLVWNRLGLPSEPILPRAKGQHRTDKRHYSEILDEEARALIARTCAREIAAFDYGLEETCTGKDAQ